jgi:hypothetical protein
MLKNIHEKKMRKAIYCPDFSKIAEREAAMNKIIIIIIN